MDLEKLRALKERGSAVLKKYHEAPPADCLVEVDPWLIGYVREEAFVREQQTLTISRLDRDTFNVSDIPPVIWEIFGKHDGWVHFSKFYRNRGFTRMFIMEGGDAKEPRGPDPDHQPGK